MYVHILLKNFYLQLCFQKIHHLNQTFLIEGHERNFAQQSPSDGVQQCPSFCCLEAVEVVEWVRVRIRCNRNNCNRIRHHLPIVQVVGTRLNCDKNNLCCNDQDSLSFLKKCIAEYNTTGSRHWMLKQNKRKMNQLQIYQYIPIQNFFLPCW